MNLLSLFPQLLVTSVISLSFMNLPSHKVLVCITRVCGD